MNGNGYRYLTKVLSWAAYTGLALMTLFAFGQVIARYAFNAAMSWPEEACSYLFLCVSYVGMTLCVENNSHLRIDILLKYMPERYQRILNIIAELGDILFSLILTFLGAYMAWDIWDMHQMTVSFYLPVWMVVAVIPITAFCMFLYALRNLVSMRQRRLV